MFVNKISDERDSQSDNHPVFAQSILTPKHDKIEET